jgi:hypothetical protein
MTREYGQFIGSAIDVRDDLRDIGRRLDALEAGSRSSEPEPREVGWYPSLKRGRHQPMCVYWNGYGWFGRANHQAVLVAPPDWIGPRLDLPEGR